MKFGFWSITLVSYLTKVNICWFAPPITIPFSTSKSVWNVFSEPYLAHLGYMYFIYCTCNSKFGTCGPALGQRVQTFHTHHVTYPCPNNAVSSLWPRWFLSVETLPLKSFNQNESWTCVKARQKKTNKQPPPPAFLFLFLDLGGSCYF